MWRSRSASRPGGGGTGGRDRWRRRLSSARPTRTRCGASTGRSTGTARARRTAGRRCWRRHAATCAPLARRTSRRAWRRRWARRATDAHASGDRGKAARNGDAPAGAGQPAQDAARGADRVEHVPALAHDAPGLAPARAGAGGEGGGVKDIVRWWFEAPPDAQIVSMFGWMVSVAAVLWFLGAVVAMLCGWQPWAAR